MYLRILKSEKDKISREPGSSKKVYCIFSDSLSQNVCPKCTRSSKIGLSMESLIANLFEFSSAVARLLILKRRLGTH